MEKIYKWATEDIFSSDNEWNKTFEEVSKKIDFSTYRGKLGNAEDFLSCMKEQEQVGRIVEKLSVYAMMKHDENTKDALYDSMVSKITSLGAKIGEKTAFVMPELTALSEDTLKSFIENENLKE